MELEWCMKNALEKIGHVHDKELSICILHVSLNVDLFFGQETGEENYSTLQGYMISAIPKVLHYI